MGDPDRRPSRHRPAFGSTPQQQRALKRMPSGAHPIGRDVPSCKRGVPRASFSSQSTHPHLAHLAPDAQCAPRFQVFGFSAAAVSFGSTTALHVKGLLTRMRNARCRSTSRTIIEWASSGPCANGALGCSLWYRPPSSRRDAGQRSRSCA